MTSPRAPRPSAGGCGYGGAAVSDAQSITLALAASGMAATAWPFARCTTTGVRRPFAWRMAATGACSRSARRAAPSSWWSACCAAWGFWSAASPCPARPPRAAPPRADERRMTEKRRRQALEVWEKAVAIGGTLAERYLRNRSIAADLPPTLRFHGACWHASGQRLPALLALVERGARQKPIGVHRVYLAEPGRKAEVDPVKASLGPVRRRRVSAHCRKNRNSRTGAQTSSGRSGRRGRGHRDGPEPPGRPPGSSPSIRATLSTSGMTGLALPDGQPGRLIIASDNDAAGRKAATALADRACALGWTVQYLRPPAGRKDWNEVLREGA